MVLGGGDFARQKKDAMGILLGLGFGKPLIVYHPSLTFMDSTGDITEAGPQKVTWETQPVPGNSL